MDIKTIATGVGLVITIAGLFVFQGQDIAINKAEIAVLKAKVDEIKARSDNPLSQ